MGMGLNFNGENQRQRHDREIKICDTTFERVDSGQPYCRHQT